MAKKKKKKKKSQAKSKSKTKQVANSKTIKKSLLKISHDLETLITGVQSASAVTQSNKLHTVFFDIGNTLLVPEMAGGRQWVWATFAKETVTALKTANVSVGLISNTGTLTRGSIASRFPNGFFEMFSNELIVLSSEVEMEKPDLGIFYHALSRSGAAPQACLFVGENRTEVLAAQQVGMRAFRIADFANDFRFLESLFS